MSDLNGEIVFDLSAEDVKRIRGKTEMTQKEFSSAFGINLSTLRHWERGDRAPHGSAVILLNLIDKSPREVYSILENKSETNVEKSENKEVLKSLIISGNYKSFSDVVGIDSESFKKVVLSLISANGFPYQSAENLEEKIVFSAGHSPNNLSEVLSCNFDGSEPKGELKEVIENTYSLIFAIEHELSEAMYLPHDMRQSRIDSVISRLGVDVAFYSNVLKNW